VRCALVVIAACGGAPPAPAPRPIVRDPAAPATPLVFRQLHVRAGGASRTTFELTLDGDRATMIETDERADGSAWTRRSSRTYRGTRHGADLELATDDMQPLALTCESRAIRVAARGEDCAALTLSIDALVCTAPGQSAADADADDELVFASPPIEWLDAACGGGLRQGAP
jgi:hypothetical protein